MDKITMLFIRACKSNNPINRLKRIYKSVYYSRVDDFPAGHICDILSEIVVDYDLINLRKFLFDYSDPMQAWKYGSFEKEHYYMRMTKALISIISLTPVKAFGGEFIKPVKFRRNNHDF